MMMRPRQTLLAGALALTTGCASLTPDVRTAGLDPRLASIGNLSVRSDFETRTLYAARVNPPPVATDKPDGERRRATPILFFVGLGVFAIAGAAAIGTGVAGVAERRSLDAAYFDQGLTVAEYDARLAEGQRLDTATKALAGVAGAGLATALISYGIDWIRCGPLAPKRRRATASPGRCRESEQKKK